MSAEWQALTVTGTSKEPNDFSIGGSILATEPGDRGFALRIRGPVSVDQMSRITDRIHDVVAEVLDEG